MKKLGFGILITLVSSSSFAQVAPSGKVAELGLHRLERLVILKKIEASFQTKAISLSISNLPVTNPATDPSFKVEIAEGKATDWTQKTLVLLSDQTGKVLSFSVAGTLDPVQSPNFPTIDAVSLLEVGLHCVQGEAVGSSDLCSKIPELPQFDDHFKIATLSEVKNSAGVISGAKVEVLGEGVAQKAVIFLKLDGTLVDVNPIQILPVL